MAHVLFVCVQNAGRSQLAEELFRRAAGEHHEARSAGTKPAAHVHPEVVALVPELAGRVPHELERADAEWADTVVTMGCGDECPYIPGKSYVEWDLEDPAGKDAETVRRIRDEIDRRISLLLDELAVAA
jgi:arsenate reductase (thioredoxin)